MSCISQPQILISLTTGSKAKEKQISRLGREAKEWPAALTRLCGLQQKALVWIQAKELAELLHIFRAVLGLDHHHVSSAEPADAAGTAEHGHRQSYRQSTVTPTSTHNRGEATAQPNSHCH